MIGFRRYLENVEFSGQVEEASPGGEGCDCVSGLRLRPYPSLALQKTGLNSAELRFDGTDF